MAHEAVKAFWGNREAARQKQIEKRGKFDPVAVHRPRPLLQALRGRRVTSTDNSPQMAGV